MAVRLTNFGGIVPRTSRRLVGDHVAQIAANCKLSSGELIPFNAPKKQAATAAQNCLTLYRAAENASSYHWMSFAQDVDIVKAPLFGKAKFCWTGDGEPRIADMTALGAGTAYTLGTPKPVTAPSVTPTGGVAANTERWYTYTFIAKWDDVELEGAKAPLTGPVTGKPDGTWAITNMDATPINGGSGTASGQVFTASAPHWLRIGEQVTILSALRTVTAVAGLTFTVDGSAITGATTWARKAPFPGTITKNLYRSTGTSGQFQLVAENIAGTTFNDTLTDGQIPGDELISADWDMPPVGLKGLCVLPSGALCGFLGNKVYFSEPNQPQAWPGSYALTSDFPVAAVASFGTGVLAATNSRPFIITGTEPGQMYGQAWEEVLPCLSKKSMVSLGDMAIYAAPVGLVAVNSSGAQLWSQAYFTETEWKRLNPASMLSAYAARRLYVRYANGDAVRTLTFNLNGDNNYLTEIQFDADTLYADDTTGELYFARLGGIYLHDPDDGFAMAQDWMSKEIVLPKPGNLSAAKVNFDLSIDPAQQAAIEAEIAATIAHNAPLLASGNVRGAWNAKPYGGANAVGINGSILKMPPEAPPQNEVTFQLYRGTPNKEMTLVAARTVTDSKPFRLPSGYKAESIAVRVISQCPIKSIELGASPSDLATA